jgi:hypothetical protein
VRQDDDADADADDDGATAEVGASWAVFAFPAAAAATAAAAAGRSVDTNAAILFVARVSQQRGRGRERDRDSRISSRLVAAAPRPAPPLARLGPSSRRTCERRVKREREAFRRADGVRPCQKLSTRENREASDAP